ncbi:TIGR02391 family protein [Kitasatospora sp. NBC_01287]|uniref:TIGR02391 family protein n=1 Tax=Kitasatospora sp. NBC_01287 TaxID=2903573 RepID=UPI00225AA06C|nr:TIGR02391 family protein [Kitasatospora sp. NBC_01287]MCX4745196.1 TIGR02391 family protein [Kitasatospora sp. NBC_01287]
MDRDWMRQQLEAFDNLAMRYEASERHGGYIGDRTLYEQLHRLEPTIKQILRLLDPKIAEKIDIDQMAGPIMARNEVHRGLGILASMDEWAARLTPDAPTLAADQLHPWVWEPASPLWAAEARQDAVLAAARTVNRRLQQKLGRHDIGETDLCLQTFDLKEPVAGKPRLRFPDDRNTPTWRARQEGAKYLAAGVFLAIRNVAAHEDEVSWTEQEALEHLATLSVLARWIGECTVESAG